MMSNSEMKYQSKNLSDIWAYCVNPEEIKIAASKEREYSSKDQIQLSIAEKTGLYELLALDKNKTILSFMDGEFHQDEVITTEILICLNSLYILVGELNTSEMLSENGKRVSKFKELYSDQSQAAKSFGNRNAYRSSLSKSKFIGNNDGLENSFAKDAKKTQETIHDGMHAKFVNLSTFNDQHEL